MATAHAVVAIHPRSTAMGGKIDQITGRIKEAAGALTDDDRLRREGQLDQMIGAVKEKAAMAAERVKNTVEKAADTLKDA
jgi:uncharacterized protein YjbJ (UPF0337 family)